MNGVPDVAYEAAKFNDGDHCRASNRLDAFTL